MEQVVSIELDLKLQLLFESNFWVLTRTYFSFFLFCLTAYFLCFSSFCFSSFFYLTVKAQIEGNIGFAFLPPRQAEVWNFGRRRCTNAIFLKEVESSQLKEDFK